MKYIYSKTFTTNKTLSNIFHVELTVTLYTVTVSAEIWTSYQNTVSFL